MYQRTVDDGRISADFESLFGIHPNVKTVTQIKNDVDRGQAKLTSVSRE